eukprot:CAMPEP_0196140282 /NCGR_PEP_ID=MMETSP0910-20130528/7244_1 /TAXON_ID=49265 /ORGANISM="Thalassiosira rotula, Strain GSO102" /LENGTH=60 /DNA_ID=CAMNT_0041401119 /DNA_START=33 /DNA_END=215 /DNA_ORIENTATION=+
MEDSTTIRADTNSKNSSSLATFNHGSISPSFSSEGWTLSAHSGRKRVTDDDDGDDDVVSS